MSNEATLERERARATPAAITAFLAVALLIASFVSRGQIPTSSNSSTQLLEFHAHSSALLLSSILSGIGFALFAVPLAYLFTAARARSPRVQPALIALCFVGPVLIGVQGIINGFGLKNASADFAAMQQEQPQSLKAFKKDLDAKPVAISKVNIYTDANQLEVERTNGSFYRVDYKQSQEKALLGAKDATSVSSGSTIGTSGVDTSFDSGGKVPDAEASKAADDNSTVSLAANLIFPAALAMIVAVIYTALQSYRVGLLTRFFGTLGMALGAALILLPSAPIFLALWLGWLGLIFIDKVPGGRPPAWAAGEAVPWPAAGAARKPDGTVEGTAREADTSSGNGSASTAGPTQKRKRKRRR
jgi:hypothetical protein